jgi:hypothetical protein
MISIKQSRLIVSIFLSALALLACGACDALNQPINANTPAPSATMAVRQQPSTTRPSVLIQYCDDTTASYPHTYFLAANKLIASSLQQAVTANQDGVTLYATAINHNTFDPRNTLSTFTIPAVPAYGAPPTPWPTNAPANPVTDNATATAISDKTQQGIQVYNGTVTVVDQKLNAAKSQVNAELGRLAKWNPGVDSSGTSILGCFQLAVSRFENQPGAKMIYIASDMENTTDIDYTASFVKDQSLAGVIVHVIFFYSPSASRDQQKRAQWCPLLTAAGAKVVIFHDPAQALGGTDMFDTDLATPSQPCPQ